MARGDHHPNVEKWRDLVSFFWNELGRGDEVDYALMVMWGESMGDSSALGPSVSVFGKQSRGHGLFQHMDAFWNDRFRQAAAYWKSRAGVELKNDPNDPMANIAVAAWLRQIGGWGHWEAVSAFYPEGAFVDGQTTWDGRRYTQQGVASPYSPPIGDGRTLAASTEAWDRPTSPGSTGEYDWPFVNPLPEAVAPPSGAGLFGAGRGPMTDVYTPGVNQRAHEGIDLSAPEGTPILATAPGTVVAVGNSSTGAPVYASAGNVVIIDHGGGWVSEYFHVADGGIYVQKGDRVDAGQIIAAVGATGNADGPHLHFQLMKDGTAVDPLTYGVLGRIEQGSGATQSWVNTSARQGASGVQGYMSQLWNGVLDQMSLAVAGGERTPLSFLYQQQEQPMSRQDELNLQAQEEADQADDEEEEKDSIIEMLRQASEQDLMRAAQDQAMFGGGS